MKAEGTRRKPVQRRGQKRLEELLEAADRVFAEVGYDQATTNRIAEEAGAPIGSLYQFFKDKEGLLAALADRYLVRLRAVHEEVLNAEATKLPLETVYDRVISALAAFHRRNPGFQALFYGSPTSPSLKKAADMLHEECIGRVEAMMALREPHLPPERRRLIATLNVDVMRALFHRANSGDEAFRVRLMPEIKALLLGYTVRALSAAAE
jgi:AcrR family transcriptional regulator